ncbi:MAG TPA: efflux RND transporter periplasmic adaptor subunit [Vicinamibacteria bacterium]|nr:efflux RND transporter periplasmic adaptor subunit [Vicinamibacteria bacterium]
MTHAERAVGIALAVGLAACGGSKPSRSAAPPDGPPRPVATAAVERTGRAEASAPGAVRARQRATLAARIPASVVELPHREGDRVAAGAVAVRLDDAALRAAVSAAEAALASAEAELRRTDALASSGAATPREREDAVARASEARAAHERAKDGLAYAALRAPFAGRVARKPVNVGDVVSPGDPLLELEGDDGYEIVAAVEGDAASALPPGSTTSAKVDGLAAPLAVRVTALSPAADPATHRFEIRADLPRAAGLRSGLFARLHLPASDGSARLTVPAQAVLARGGLSGVFVVEGGRARLRWIAVGATSGARTEVRAGLEAGERVALDPGVLRDGQPVAEAR